MKVYKNDLKKVIAGKMTIKEAQLRYEIKVGKQKLDEIITTKATDADYLENDSLDVQVDRFLTQGESTENAQLDGQVVTGPKTEGLLREAPGDQETPSGKELDAVTFADNVARLVEKNDTLLDIKGTILRRALNWVTKNYDAKQASEVKQILEGNFGLYPESTVDPYEDEPVPAAKGAGPDLAQ